MKATLEKRSQAPPQLHNIVRTIVEKFDPEKIILFGSHAWGTPGPDSDVDLLVVKETSSPWDLGRAIDGALWGRTIGVDIIVYSPDQILRRLRMKDSFLKQVLEYGKVVYDR